MNDPELAILAPVESVFALDGSDLGRLDLPGGVLFAPAVSADGRFLAWFPRPDDLGRPPIPREQKVRISDGVVPLATVTADDYPGAFLAVSNSGRKVALVTTRPGRPRLVLIDTRTNERRDLSEFVRFGLKETERLRLSGDGNLLVISSRKSFYAISPPSSVVSEHKGRFPALSPSGGNVAYVNEDSELSVTNIKTDATTVLRAGGKLDFVGAWSPDGNYIFAGVRVGLLGSETRLVIVDVTAKSYREWSTLPGETVDTFSWISRDLVDSFGTGPGRRKGDRGEIPR